MRKKVATTIYYAFDWINRVTLEKLKQDIAELEKLGATEVDIHAAEDWGFSYVSITAARVVLETDEEYSNRLKKEKKEKLRLEAEEVAIYQKLKAKYEPS